MIFPTLGIQSCLTFLKYLANNNNSSQINVSISCLRLRLSKYATHFPAVRQNIVPLQLTRSNHHYTPRPRQTQHSQPCTQNTPNHTPQQNVTQSNTQAQRTTHHNTLLQKTTKSNPQHPQRLDSPPQESLTLRHASPGSKIFSNFWTNLEPQASNFVFFGTLRKEGKREG